MGAREQHGRAGTFARVRARAERRALARARDRARANPAWLLAEYIAPQARERSAACMLRSQRWLMFRELLWPTMRSCRAALSSWTNARRRGRPLPVVMSVGALRVMRACHVRALCSRFGRAAATPTGRKTRLNVRLVLLADGCNCSAARNPMALCGPTCALRQEAVGQRARSARALASASTSRPNAI